MTRPKAPDAHIFEVETRFQALARRSGGIPREQALEKAQEKIEEVKPQFDEWLDIEMDKLTTLIKKVQAGTADSNWVAAAIIRTRQLHHSSATLGAELLAFIAGSLRDVLESIESGSEINMESITCHVDALVLARQASYRRLRPDQVPELTEGLRQVVRRIAV
jgi:hypothetical protein